MQVPIATIAEEQLSDLTDDVLQENGEDRDSLGSPLGDDDQRVLQGEGYQEGRGSRVRLGSAGTTNSNRFIPSQNSRARMSRTSNSAGTVKMAVDMSSSDEEEGTRSVLITELRDEDDDSEGERKKSESTPRIGVVPGRVTNIRLGRTRKKNSQSDHTQDNIRQDEEEWDTDLEGDAHTFRDDDDAEGVDLTGRMTYTKLCDKLGVVPVSYFTRHIKDHEIVMRYHGLGPGGTHAIAKVLKDNITLERLNLAGNWMEGEGAMHMSRMLQENDYITDLSLAENKLGSVGILHISKMLGINTGLRRLDLSNNELSDRDAGLLADALEQNKFLRELILSHNRFGQEAGEILGPAIGANDVLDYIDLSWNQIRKKGAVAIARGLKENIRLKVCNLAYNGFGSEGGAAVGDAIGANETLQELDLSGNRLDGAAATSLSRGIRKNEDLLTLKLGHNPITTKGAIDIATALHDNENSQLEYVDLTDIPVEYEFTRLCDVIRKKRDLAVVNGTLLRSGNTADDIGRPAIDPYLRDPMLVLREHIVVNDLRIFEFLQKYDDDHSYSITPEQFASALEELGVSFSREQLEELAQKLDTNSDGRVFYGDIFKQMEASAQKAQEKGYMGILPKTPAEPSRGQSFLGDSLNESANQPLLESQVIRSTTDATPSDKVLNSSVNSAVSRRSSADHSTSVQSSTTVGRLAFTKKEIPVE